MHSPANVPSTFCKQITYAERSRSFAIVINLVLRDCRPSPNQKPESAILSLTGYSEWGLNVIRTIWLGLTFLIILAAVASFRFAYGNFDATNASSISRQESNRIVVARAVQQPVAIAAPLPAAYVPPAPADPEFARPEPDLDPVEPLLRVPPAIVATSSPPWREIPAVVNRKMKGPKIKRKDAEFANSEPDLDPVEPLLRVPPAIAATNSSSPPWRDLSSFATQQKDQKIRRKSARKETVVVDKDLVAAEPKTCQLEDFDALRWAFNLPTGCFSSASLL